jgi:hypothetical protein
VEKRRSGRGYRHRHRQSADRAHRHETSPTWRSREPVGRYQNGVCDDLVRGTRRRGGDRLPAPRPASSTRPPMTGANRIATTSEKPSVGAHPIMPPSTRIVWPVMYDAASEQRMAAISARPDRVHPRARRDSCPPTDRALIPAVHNGAIRDRRLEDDDTAATQTLDEFCHTIYGRPRSWARSRQ